MWTDKSFIIMYKLLLHTTNFITYKKNREKTPFYNLAYVKCP